MSEAYIRRRQTAEGITFKQRVTVTDSFQITVPEPIVAVADFISLAASATDIINFTDDSQIKFEEFEFVSASTIDFITFTDTATALPQLQPPIFEIQGLEVSTNSFTVVYTNPNNVNAILRVGYAVPNSGGIEGEQTVSINAFVNSAPSQASVTFTNGPQFQVDPSTTYEVFARLEQVTGFTNSEFVTNLITTQAPTVTATFNSNGGSPNFANQSGFSPLTVNNPGSPTRTGYTFAGWNNGLGFNASIVITQNTTFTAQWTANQYTVTLDKNGGTGGTNSVIATFDAPMPAATAPTRSLHNFLGYWDAVSFGTQYYTSAMASARTWNKPNNATLFARWQLIQTAMPTITLIGTTQNSVTFSVTNNDANTATIRYGLASPPTSGNIPVVSGGNTGNITLSGLLAGTNYSILATAEASGKAISGEAVQPFTTQSPPPPTVTATFNSNGGTPTYSSQSGPSPLSVFNPGSPTRSGFTFQGWSPSVPRQITTNTTFVAQWQAVCPPFGQLVDTYCSGFTLVGVYADGNCGTFDQVIENNSPSCGFVVCPAQGTLLDTRCEGFTLIGIYADGNCGSFEQTIETNSTQCGFTAPTTYSVTGQIERGAPASWSLSVSITYRGSSRTISTSSATTLDSAIAEGTSVTISAPSSVSSGGQTYTFVRWRVNGTLQTLGQTSLTRTINANTEFRAIYEIGGLGGF